MKEIIIITLRIFLFIIYFFFMYGEALFAQNFYASSQGAGQYIKVRFVIENGKVSNFIAPDFKGFNIVSGPNTSQSTQFINGTMSNSMAYEYVLQPIQTGKLTIQAATAVINGRTMQSNTLNFTASASTPQQVKEKIRQEIQDEQVTEENIFVKVEVNKKEVYVGEQFTVTYKLYTQLSLTGYTLTELPQWQSCWNEEVKLPKELVLTEKVNGRDYKVIVFKKDILVPQRAGTLEIPKVKMDATVRLRVLNRQTDPFNNSPFANDPFFKDVFKDMFSYHNQMISLSSRSENMKVKELPIDNQPSNYAGAVGDFTAAWKLDAKIPHTDEPYLAQLQINGKGNLNFIEAPQIKTTDGLDLYDPEIIDAFHQGAENIEGTRNFNFTIIPKRAGVDSIASIDFTYFDTDQEKYKTIHIPAQILKSLKNKTANKGNIKEPIISELSLTYNAHKQFFNTYIYWLLIFLPIVSFLIYLAIIRYKKNEMADPEKYRNKQATRQAIKRLKNAHFLLQKNDIKGFYAELRNTILQFVSDKSNVGLGEVTKKNVSNLLLANGYDTRFASEIISLIDASEIALYAPIHVDTMKNDYQRVESLFIKSNK